MGAGIHLLSVKLIQIQVFEHFTLVIMYDMQILLLYIYIPEVLLLYSEVL